MLVNDIDKLLDHKSEFNKKTDFLFDKLMEISEDVHNRMAKMVKEFEAIKNPILNKVQDINQIAELYHQEINRT